MAYLHCHSCNWGQDDFWEKNGYNPVKSLRYCEDYLFKDKVYMDKWGIDDRGLEAREDEGGYWVPGHELAAAILMSYSNNIKNMAVKTEKEWEKVKDDFKCPKCGSDNWDID